MRWRRPGPTAGLGASSMIFWWRRCTEQSRSPRCTTWPWRSANTCSSTWRGRSRARSISRRPSPKPARASLWALALAGIAGQAGHAMGQGQGLGAGLAAQRPDGLRRRADPVQARVEHGLGEVGVLAQKAIARVHRVGAGGAVGLAHVQGLGIGVGVNGHRLQAQGPGGVDDPAGDFAAVGDQQSFEHQALVLPSGARQGAACLRAKACRPAAASGPRRALAKACAAWSSQAGRGGCPACSKALVAATAPGAAALRASRRWVRPAFRSGTTSVTRPSARACSAEWRSPPNSQRRARASPSRRSTKGAIWAGTMPSVTSGAASTAPGVASTQSAQHTRPRPPPMAGPSTAASRVWGRAHSASSSCPNSRFMGTSGSGWPGARAWPRLLAKPPKLPPAQKLPPAPRSTTARRAGSSAARAQACSRACTSSAVRALRLGGAFSTQCSTQPGPRGWRSISKWVMAWASAARTLGDAHDLGQDAQHHLVGAATDGAQPTVAVQAGHFVLPGEAHAAPELQAAVGDAAVQATGLELGHAGQLGHVLPLHIEFAGAVGEGAQALQLGLHLGQLELHPLLVGQGGAEHLAFLGPLDGGVEAVLQRLQATGGGPQALFLELLHLVDEALALGPDQVALRHAHLVEIDQAGVAAVHADLPDLARHLDAWGEAAVVALAQGHHDQALVLVHRAFAGVDQHAHPVGLQAVGDPHLLAGDDVVVAVLARHALDAGHIAAGAGLGHADAAHRIARDGRGQELAAQFVAAEARQRRGAHVGLHANRHGHAAAVDVAQGLGHGQAVAVVQAGAAVGLGLGQAQQAQLPHLLEHLVGRKDLGLFPFVHMGVDLGVDEALERLLDFAVLMGELHGVSPFLWFMRGARPVGGYMRATPNCIGRTGRASASAHRARHWASTARLSRGSITPSSSSRALVWNTSAWASNMATICSNWVWACWGSGVWPLRARAASVTICMVRAACSPPITAVRACGQVKRKRGA